MMTGQVEIITPDKVDEEYLSFSKGNRAFRSYRIENYARDIKEKRWRLHHQGIAFDETGALIDGHHRLMAIKAAGIAVRMFVVRGVPCDSYAYIDGNLPRSLRDAEIMAGGEKRHNSEWAVALIIDLLPRSIAAKHKTREEVIATMRKHHEAIAYASRWQMRGLTRGARTLIARAYYHVERQRLDEFCKTLTTGFVSPSNSPEFDSAAIVYRNFLIKFTGQTGQKIEIERYRKGQSCLMAFTLRNPFTKTYGTDDDLFPMPKSTADSDA